MKCTRCGSDIPDGYVYCSVCGKEVQLVPDYNYLEEDVLSKIIQEGVKETAPKKKKKKKSKTASRKKTVTAVYLELIFGIVIVSAILVVFLVESYIQKKHDNSYEYQYEMAQTYLEEKDYESALDYFNRALELQPMDKDSLYQIADIDLIIGERRQSIEILSDMISRDPGDQTSYRKLIDIYVKDKDYKAIRDLSKEVTDSAVLELFADYLVDPPTFNRISGTYTNSQSITITSVKGYQIYYTTDGSDPAKEGILYHNAIPLKEGTTVISAVTRNEKGIDSEVVTATYSIKYEAPNMPTVTPSSGTYNQPQMITVSVPADCIAYYTWDGSIPTEASAVYTEPLEMPPGNNVLSILLVNSVGLKSNIYRVNYVYMPE